eukprot:6203098-Pleurochrysis_carterae.AAC.1
MFERHQRIGRDLIVMYNVQTIWNESLKELRMRGDALQKLAELYPDQHSVPSALPATQQTTGSHSRPQAARGGGGGRGGRGRGSRGSGSSRRQQGDDSSEEDEPDADSSDDDDEGEEEGGRRGGEEEEEIPPPVPPGMSIQTWDGARNSFIHFMHWTSVDGLAPTWHRGK